MTRKPLKAAAKPSYANLHLRLAHRDHEKVQAYAASEHRSVAQMLSLLIVESIENREAVAKPIGRRAA